MIIQIVMYKCCKINDYNITIQQNMCDQQWHSYYYYNMCVMIIDQALISKLQIFVD